MAPKPKPWFRFYVEAMHDRKLRRLKPEHRWLWVAVLAAARQSPAPGELRISNGDPMDADDLADLAALTVKQVDAGLALFTKSDMLIVEDGVYRVVAWDARQYESDTSTERSKRSRQRRKQQEGDDDATLHSRPMRRPASVTENREQRTDTEPVSTRSSSKSVATPAAATAAAVDEQQVRRTAALVGRATVPPTAANPDAYAAGTTKAILTGADPSDRERIADALAAGATPEAIAATWRPDPVAVARQTVPAAPPRPACPACDTAGVLLDDTGTAHRCPVCNGGTRTDLIPTPTLKAVP